MVIFNSYFDITSSGMDPRHLHQFWIKPHRDVHKVQGLRTIRQGLETRQKRDWRPTLSICTLTEQCRVGKMWNIYEEFPEHL